MSGVRIAVIGAGAWAQRVHLPALHADPTATIAAIVDANLDQGRAVAAEFNAEFVYTGVDELIAAGGIDGVVVATPHASHASITAAMLIAGIPVLVEKPLAITSEEANRLVRLVRSSGVLLAVGYTAQYTAAATAVRRWVQEDIGELRQVIVEFSSRAAELYAAADPDDPLSAYSAATGSGQATTQLSHAFGAITSTTGLAFTDIAAFTRGRETRVDVDDVVAFRMEGGVTGTAASTGSISVDLPMKHAVRYLGDRGIVEHDLLHSMASIDRPRGVREIVQPGHLEPLYPAHAPVRAFTAMICDGGTNAAPVWPAAAAVAAIEAIHRSAAANAVVFVSPTPR